MQKRRSIFGLFFLFVLGTINFADKAIIGLAAGPIIAEFHLNATQWGFIGSAFFALFSVSSLVVPFIHYGTNKVLGLLALLWAFVQFVSILPMSFLFLLGTRVLLGAGEGPFYGMTVHLATLWTAPDRRGVTLAFLTLGSAIGPVLLSPALVLLIVQFGWRGAFGVLGAIGVLWCIGWWWYTRALPEEPLREKKTTPMSMLATIGTLLRNRSVLGTILAGFAGYWYLALLIAWIPQYFHVRRDLPIGSALYVIAITLPWLGGGIALLVVNAISDGLWRSTHNLRVARVIPLVLCLLVGAALLAIMVIVPSTIGAIVCLMFVPLGAVFPLVAVLLAEMVPASQRIQTQGIGVAVYSLAGLIAPATTGIVIQRAVNPSMGFSLAFFLGASVIACLGFLCLWLVRPNILSERTLVPGVPLASLEEDL